MWLNFVSLITTKVKQNFLVNVKSQLRVKQMSPKHYIEQLQTTKLNF